MSYIYGYVGGSGVISGGMTGGTGMTEDETMRKYAEAHGCPAYGLEGEYVLCGERYAEEKGLGVRPFPCVRDEHGEIREQTVKELFTKINEELDELKAVVFYSCDVSDPNCLPESCDDMLYTRIAQEAADTITAITTLLEALNIDAEERDEAQRRVNSKNRERGRL